MEGTYGKRLLSLLLAVCMVMGMLPGMSTHVHAEDEAATIAEVGSTTTTKTPDKPLDVDFGVYELTKKNRTCDYTVEHTHSNSCYKKECDHDNGHLATCYGDQVTYALCTHASDSEHTGSSDLGDVVTISGTDVHWVSSHPAYTAVKAEYDKKYAEAYEKNKWMGSWAADKAAKAAGVAALVGKKVCYTVPEGATPDACTHTCSAVGGSCYRKTCIYSYEHTHDDNVCFEYIWTLRADANNNNVIDGTDADPYYTVTYTDGVEGEAFVDEVHENLVAGVEMPAFRGSTERTHYTFAGWDKEPADTVSGTVTYTAQWTPVKYTITWLNEDETVFDTTEEAYGSIPSHEGPSKTGNAQYSYTFAGWDPEPKAVEGETSYKATFNEAVNKYTIQWVDYDGAVICDEDGNEYSFEVPYGDDLPEAPVNPTREGNAQYSYAFTEWSVTGTVGANNTVVGAVTYKAQYQQSVNTYTVTWKNEDDGNPETDETLEVDENVPYGTMPSYNGDTPVKENDGSVRYSFAGWDKDIAPVTGDVVYTATFDQATYYTVTFQGVSSTSVKENMTVAQPSDPTLDDHTFDGWFADADCTDAFDFDAPITSDTIIYPKWLEQFDVTFDQGDGTVEISAQVVDEGKLATEPTKEPEKDGYRFDGWNFDFSTPITGDIEIGAKWVELVTVTFNSNGGSAVKPQTFDVNGKVDTKEIETTYDKHIFKAWLCDGEVFDFNEVVKESITLVADWAKDADEDTIEDGTKEDPYYVHTYTDGVDGEEIFEDYKVTVLNEEETSYTVKAHIRDGYCFGEWVTGEPDTSKEGIVSIIHTATWFVDENKNAVVDTDETITVVVTGDGAGEVTVNGNGNATYLYNSKTATSVNVVAKPDAASTGVGYYVKRVSDNLTAYSGNGYNNTEYSGVLDVSGGGSHTVTVEFGKLTVVAKGNTIKVTGWNNDGWDYSGRLADYKAGLTTANFLESAPEGGSLTVQMHCATGWKDVNDLNATLHTQYLDLATRDVQIIWTPADSAKYPEIKSNQVKATFEDSRAILTDTQKKLTYIEEVDVTEVTDLASFAKQVAVNSGLAEKRLGNFSTDSVQPSNGGDRAEMVYIGKFNGDATYQPADITVTLKDVYKPAFDCIVTAGEGLADVVTMSVSNGTANETGGFVVTGLVETTITLNPKEQNVVETITIIGSDGTERVYQSSQISYDNRKASIKFKTAGATESVTYTVIATTSVRSLNLNTDQTIVYCVDNDGTKGLKEQIFNAVYDSSTSAPKLTANDVSVEYAYIGVGSVNLWGEVTNDPAFSFGTHKFGEDGSETIRVTYKSEKYGELKKTVDLNVFDSCYNNTITVEVVKPEGLEAEIDTKLSDSRDFRGNVYIKQNTDTTVTLTPDGKALDTIKSILTGTHSDTSVYIKSVTVTASDGSQVKYSVSRGTASILEGGVYNVSAVISAAEDKHYTVTVEYGVLKMAANTEEYVTLDMYPGAEGAYEAKIPTAEEIFNAVIGDCSEDFLEKYENMTVAYSTNGGASYNNYDEAALLALGDKTVKARITWNGDSDTYYPLAITKDITLKDPRSATEIVTADITEVTVVGDENLEDALRKALEIKVMAGEIEVDGAVSMYITETVADEESATKTYSIKISYLGSTSYKPSEKTLTVTANNIPANADINVVGNHIKNATINGQVVNGTFSIVGRAAYDVQIEPVAGWTINKVIVSDGTTEIDAELSYKSGVVTFKTPVLVEKATYIITVEFVENQFILDDERVYDFAFGWDTPANKDIADAAIEGPVDIDLSKVKIEYLARTEGKATVKIPEIDLGFTTIDLGSVDVELGELWLDPNTKVEGVDLEDAVKALPADIIAKIRSGEIKISITDISGTIASVRAYVENYIKELALSARAFGVNGDGSTEAIRMSYADDKYQIGITITDIIIHDPRIATELTASDCTVTYGYSLAQLMETSGAVVTAEGKAITDQAIASKDLYLHAKTEAQQVTLTFAGNEMYQPCEVTINVVVNKAPASIDYDSQFVTYGDDFDFNLAVSPTVMPDGTKPDIQIIEFMIGIDMENLLDLDLSDETIGLDKLTGEIRLRLPQSIRDLPLVGQYLQGEMTLDQFADTLKSLSGILGIDEESLGVLNQIIEAISGSEDLLDLKVIISDEDFVPKDIGIYIAGAVTIDDDFQTAYTADYLIIAPKTVETKLAWDYADSNGIFTPELLQYISLDAHVVEADWSDEELEKLNGYVQNLFLGVNGNESDFLSTDIYGNIKANIYVSPDQLVSKDADGNVIAENGAYIQIAYMIEWGNEIYYAVPIVRHVVIIPNTATVEFLDEYGNVNADRKFVFDNTAKTMGTIRITGNDGEVIKPKAGELTVTYTGLQTNVNPYNSTEPPVHAGAYLVTALYLGKDANGNVNQIGLGIGVMAIEPTTAAVEVKDQVFVEVKDGSHILREQVTASSAVEGLTPDTTVITAQVAATGDVSEIGWDGVTGNVNVDFPKWADELMAEYAPELYKNGMTAAEFAALMEEKLPDLTAKLDELGIDASVADSLKQTVAKVNEVLNKVDDNVTITFKDDAYAASTGVYLITAIVTDSDHYPAVDTGVVVIVPWVKQTYLKWIYEDENSIWTRKLLQNVDKTAIAYNDKEYTDKNEEATGKIAYKYLTVTENGDLVSVDEKDLGTGVYVQLAYIPLEVDGVMTVSDLIARIIVVLPDVVDVSFVGVDENHTRTFTYDGKAHEMETEVTSKLEGFKYNPDKLTVRYIGIEGDFETYNSTEAPSQAGVYAVVAIYLDREAVGATAGVMVIEKAKMEFSILPLEQNTFTYNGQEQEANVSAVFDGQSIDPDALYIYVDGVTGDASIVLEDDSTKMMELLKKLGVELEGQKISVDQLKATIESLIKKVEEADFELPETIGYSKTQILGMLQLLLDTQMTPGAVITIDGPKPVDVGTYKVYALAISANYTTEMAKGEMKIEQIELKIIIDNINTTCLAVKDNLPVFNSKLYTGYEDKLLDGDTLEAILAYEFSNKGSVAAGIYSINAKASEGKSYYKIMVANTATDAEKALGLKDGFGYLIIDHDYATSKAVFDMKCTETATHEKAGVYTGTAVIDCVCGAEEAQLTASTAAKTIAVSAEHTQEADCMNPGKWSYTAKATFNYVKQLGEADSVTAEAEAFTETIPEKGHSYGEAKFEWIAEGKNDDGSDKYTGESVKVTKTCTVCEHVLVADAVSVISRDIDVIKPDCDDDGTRIYYATAEFGNEKTDPAEMKISIPKLGHVWSEELSVFQPATCATDGKGLYECERNGCGEVNIVDIPATGVHTPAEAVRENEVAASCYAEGSYDEVVYCSVEACKHEISRTPKTIEKIAHTPAEVVRENEVAASCYAEGSYDEVVYCSVEACKHEISRTPKTIKKIAHTPAEAVYENEVAASCYAEGSYDEVVYCSVEACKHEISRTPKTIEKIAHTPGAAATETEPQICTECKCVLTPALGHTHKYKVSKVEWKPYYTGATVTFECESQDAKQVVEAQTVVTVENGKLTFTITAEYEGIRHTESKVIEVVANNGTYTFKLDETLTNVVILIAGYEANTGRMVDVKMLGETTKSVVNGDYASVLGDVVKVFFLNGTTYAPVMPNMQVK